MNNIFVVINCLYDELLFFSVLKYHKVKGCFVQPRVCLSKEQMAERNLKYYLKYFGGFHNWSLNAIGDWIRNHPEIQRKCMLLKLRVKELIQIS